MFYCLTEGQERQAVEACLGEERPHAGDLR